MVGFGANIIQKHKNEARVMHEAAGSRWKLYLPPIWGFYPQRSPSPWEVSHETPTPVIMLCYSWSKRPSTPLHVPHVEVFGYIILLDLIVKPHDKNLPNLEHLFLPIGIIPIVNKLEFCGCLNNVLTLNQPNISLLKGCSKYIVWGICGNP